MGHGDLGIHFNHFPALLDRLIVLANAPTRHINPGYRTARWDPAPALLCAPIPIPLTSLELTNTGHSKGGPEQGSEFDSLLPDRGKGTPAQHAQAETLVIRIARFLPKVVEGVQAAPRSHVA
jgi:hypothetical protein